MFPLGTIRLGTAMPIMKQPTAVLVMPNLRMMLDQDELENQP